MKGLILKITVSFCLALLSLTSYGQGSIEDLLVYEVENLNPVYKPVIGLGIGSFSYLGDIQNSYFDMYNGNLGAKVNVATFLDNNQYIRANFIALFGNLSGNQRAYEDISLNKNFKSQVLQFGFNVNYDFDNFYKRPSMIHPFVSVGFTILTFDSKTDSLGENNLPYQYWNDGTIRDVPQVSAQRGNIISRDYDYETSLGSRNTVNYGFTIPVDMGLDFWLSDRVMCRVGTSYNIAFTDLIDNVVSSDNSGNFSIGKDDFLYSYFSVHLDLFSSDKELMVKKLFVDLGYDNTLLDDEDGDGSWDGFDNCPGTPWGVKTDSVGCPIDSDLDQVPDYLDDEPNSRLGAMVDNRGIELTEQEVIALVDQTDAVARKDISKYIRTPTSYNNYKRITTTIIPKKFLKVDDNDDGYLSFDEMMNALDDFFDFESELETNDIYELNEFFFSQ